MPEKITLAEVQELEQRAKQLYAEWSRAVDDAAIAHQRLREQTEREWPGLGGWGNGGTT